MKKFLYWFVVGLVLLVGAVFILLAINEVLPPGWKLDADVLIVLASGLLSFAFLIIPTLRVKFAGLPAETKIYVNIVLVILFAVFMFLGTCTGWLPITGIVCTVVGLKTLLVWVFLAIGGNQLTYKVASVKLPSDVVEAKASRDSEG